ncbi:carbon-nitrogen hydrolase family protein [Pseudodesulfovibrio sp. JC047]|uniref:carbon-nitrogen hydrolase family protein n=1 Tax=Pseudodesulfovibrio sp. JC047 TaxID=2683199 RepID=UPI0013D4E145|nr:carbon-nitrogen hydrolase family protein [Pseudodesulfovibrio sp. JC047]NDV20220.1 carbon-nitrogen hydrolase family protein [Pseudodesulfovibrio sp. JC047]
MKKRTVAALQVGSEHGTAATLETILGYETAIRQSGCHLLVLPEAILGGYPKGADFGTRLGYRTPEGRDDFLKYWNEAVDIDGPEITQLCGLAKRCETAMVVGIIERGGSTLYCTALFIAEDGTIAGKHRKLMPTATERLIWGQGDGSTLPVIETPAGRVAGAICWENYMPLLRATMYGKGMDIWCAPTVDSRDIWVASMQFIAYEGRNFLVSACQYQGPPTDETHLDPTWPKDEPLIRGNSIIISPMGDILAGPLRGKEGLISAEIDLDDIIKARYDMDIAGHYARPDVFTLTVDERPRPAFKNVPDTHNDK